MKSKTEYEGGEKKISAATRWHFADKEVASDFFLFFYFAAKATAQMHRHIDNTRFQQFHRYHSFSSQRNAARVLNSCVNREFHIHSKRQPTTNVRMAIVRVWTCTYARSNDEEKQQCLHSTVDRWCLSRSNALPSHDTKSMFVCVQRFSTKRREGEKNKQISTLLRFISPI